MTATSTTPDAEFPCTPNSNRSSGVCHITYTSVEAGSLTPNPSPENQHSDASRPHYSSSSEEEHIFDGLLDNLNCDQGTSKSVEQKVMEAYLRHIGQLSASSFHCIIRYLEAVHERQRMHYYMSCWDVIVVQRWEAVALSARDKSKTDFLAVEQELQFVLDILSQHLSLPRETTVDSQNLAAAHDNDRISILRTDAVLTTLKGHADPMDDWYVLLQVLCFISHVLLFYVGPVVIAKGTYAYLEMCQVLTLVIFTISIGSQLIFT
ncbi:uncharacterized protein EDB91DRAFT_1248782 [Suillus paluster]|uniref:uncharacterized protein n=1 Tax=Suillus paluster TaxID=48578 RepID=UPI001B87ADF3|nr:uncharacterized protein EDB91DRAFT_1248782 [Suillus paluster]KAG1739429.1 hypothetical protein EDB91DRAFT_1248782 [Suillus paluster]